MHKVRGQLTTGSKSVDEMLSANKCVICLDAPKSRACVPCGHVCVCERCAAPLTHCPICREECTDLMRIYLS